MRFVVALRERLMALKVELEGGLLPQGVYEDLCKSTITEFGNSAFEQSNQTENDSLSDLPSGNKHRKVAHLLTSSLSHSTNSKEKVSMPATRRTYSKEEKLFVVALRDSGMSTDTIATRTSVPKNTVEKWLNDKMKAQIIEKARSFLTSGLFSTQNITICDNKADRAALILRLKERIGGMLPSEDTNNIENSIQLIGRLLNVNGDPQHSLPRTIYTNSSSNHETNSVISSLSFDNSDFKPQLNSSSGSTNSLIDFVRVHNPPSSSHPTTNKLLHELLETAELFEKEEDGSYSMSLQDLLPSVATLNATLQDHTSEREETDFYISSSNKLTASITMSFSSTLLEDSFSTPGGITMSTTNQALFPVLNNTRYITGYYEAEAIRAMAALSVTDTSSTICSKSVENVLEATPVPTARTALQIQEDEDKRVLSLLGEKRMTDKMIRHYRALGKISFE